MGRGVGDTLPLKGVCLGVEVMVIGVVLLLEGDVSGESGDKKKEFRHQAGG